MYRICLMVWLAASPASAQEGDGLNNLEVAQNQPAPVEDDQEVKYGWAWAAGLTLGGNVLQNSNTISQVEGRTNIYLGKMELSLDNRKQDSEWQNRLTLEETFSQTPTIERLIKTGDVLKASSVYKHFFPSIKWLGGFTSFSMETTAFATYDERSEKVVYQIAESDGEKRQFQDERFKLAKPLSPMTLKESLGVVFKVFADPRYTTEFRTGPGAKQVMLKDQYFLVTGEDADATPEIEVGQYSDDVRIVGWVGLLNVEGKLVGDKLTYKMFAEFLTPMAYHPEGDDDPDRLKLTATEVGAETGYKFSDWLALTYQFKATRDPLLQPESQVTHNAMLTATLKTSG